MIRIPILEVDVPILVKDVRTNTVISKTIDFQNNLKTISKNSVIVELYLKDENNRLFISDTLNKFYVKNISKFYKRKLYIV